MNQPKNMEELVLLQNVLIFDQIKEFWLEDKLIKECY